MFAIWVQSSTEQTQFRKMRGLIWIFSYRSRKRRQKHSKQIRAPFFHLHNIGPLASVRLRHVNLASTDVTSSVWGVFESDTNFGSSFLSSTFSKICSLELPRYELINSLECCFQAPHQPANVYMHIRQSKLNFAFYSNGRSHVDLKLFRNFR